MRMDGRAGNVNREEFFHVIVLVVGHQKDFNTVNVD